ncbi:uncharacterized protein LOC116947378 isoform X2 [Petromyzon marinus]|nr:A-kinase anchor protein 12-like isoform X2 [Petromyzon marinus]XP_032818929.1 A-kinase anchor protein 12-like isoform X2 [Petromyzon marinus]
MEAVEAPGSTAVAAAAAVAVAVLPPPVEQDSKEEELLPSQTQACRKSVELFKGEGPVAVLQPATGAAAAAAAAELGADQHEQPSGQEALANDHTSTNIDHREEHARLELLANTNGADVEEGGETNSGDIEVAANPAGECQQDAHSDPVNGTENELDGQTDEATGRPDVDPKQRGELDSSSASQGNEVGFKKIFKFGGFKFTMKKDKAAQPEPAHLLKVSRGGEEGAPSSDAAHQAPRSDEPDEQPAGATEPAQDASASSGGAQGAEWSGGGGGEEEDIADLEIVDEEEVAEAIAAEAAASIAASVCKPPAEPLKEEAPVPPLKKMSGLFAGLRKKAGDKQKREEGAARAAAEDASRRPDDTRAEVEGKMAELARALEAHARGEEQAPDDQQPCSSKSEATPDVLVSMAHVLEAATCEEASSDPPAGQQQQQKLAAANGESALETADKSKGTNEAAADDDHEGDATDTSARAKARTHEGPLKKFFKGSGLKKLPSLKRKVTKEREESEHLTGDEGEPGTDGKRAQTSISVEDNNPGSPAHAKEAETKSEDSPHPGAAAVVADGRNVGAVRKREGITVWSSFKKLVTPKKRVKKAAESDTDDDPEDQADERSKSGAPAAAGRSQEARGETEEVKVTVEVHSTVEPATIATVVTATAAADVAVEDASSEAALETAALTVAASDEARTDEDVAARGTAPAASDAEVTDGPEAAAAAAAGEEERRDESKLAAGSPEGTETTAGSGGRAEGAAKQGDEGRAGDSPKRESAWESFKRLVTPKKKAKAKGDNQAGGGDEEDALQRAAADLKRDVERAAQSQTESPKRECAKAENPSAAGWSIKKLFPGMRRRKADADAEGAEAEAAASPASGRVKCAEVHQDTPSVVPLSEFESGDLSVQVERPTAVEEPELPVSQERPPEVVLGVPTEAAVAAAGPAGEDGVLDKADEPCDDREEGGSSDDASVGANAAGPTDGASRAGQPAGAASETSVTTSGDRSQHGSALAKEGESNALQNVTVDNNLAQVKIVVDAPSVTATRLETPDSEAACEGSKEMSPSLIVTENAPEKPNLSPDERDEENADKDCAPVVCVISGAESESHTAVPEAARALDGGIDGASGDLSTTARLPDLVTDASAAKDGNCARTLPGDIPAADIGCTLNGKQQSECQERAAFHEVQLKQTTVQSAANLAEQTIEQNATGETRSSRAAEEMAEEIPVQSVKDAMEAYKIPLETMVMQAPHGQDLEVIMEEDAESPPAVSGAAAVPGDGARPTPAAAKVNAEEHEWPTAAAANSARKSGVALEEETAEESDHGKGLPVIHDGHNNSNNNHHHLDDVNSQAPLDCVSVEGDKASEITSKAIPNSAGGVETLSQQKRADGPMSENNGPEDLSSAVQMDKAQQLLENSLGNSNSKDFAAQAETAADHTQEKPPPPHSEGGLLMAAAQSSVS